jgi:hypothetical protein
MKKRTKTVVLILVLVNLAVLAFLVGSAFLPSEMSDFLSLRRLMRQIEDGYIFRREMEKQIAQLKGKSLDDLGNNEAALEKACLVSVYKVFYDNPPEAERAELMRLARGAFDRQVALTRRRMRDLEAGLCFLERRYPESIEAAEEHLSHIRGESYEWEWWMFLSVACICNRDLPKARKYLDLVYNHLEPGGNPRSDVNQAELYLLELHLIDGVFCLKELPVERLEKCAAMSYEWVRRRTRDPAMERFFDDVVKALEAQKTGDLDKGIGLLEDMIAIMRSPEMSRNMRLGHFVDVVAADGFIAAQFILLGDLYEKKGLKEKAEEAFRNAAGYPAGEKGLSLRAH